MALTDEQRNEIDIVCSNVRFHGGGGEVANVPEGWNIKAVKNWKVFAQNGQKFFKIYPSINWANGLFTAFNVLIKNPPNVPNGILLNPPNEIYGRAHVFEVLHGASEFLPGPEIRGALLSSLSSNLKEGILPAVFADHVTLLKTPDERLYWHDPLDDSPGTMSRIFGIDDLEIG